MIPFAVHDPVITLIIIGFYAPLHYLMPIGYLFLTGDEATRKTELKTTLIDATLSLLLVAVLLLLLLPEQIELAVLILAIGFILPFIRLVLSRKK